MKVCGHRRKGKSPQMDVISSILPGIVVIGMPTDNVPLASKIYVDGFGLLFYSTNLNPASARALRIWRICLWSRVSNVSRSVQLFKSVFSPERS